MPGYYGQLVAQYGDSVRSTDWGGKDSQYLRFDILNELGLHLADSVLDVGCGRGDLLSYLEEKGFHGRYVGVDITPEMIQLAKRSHAGATFHHIDMIANPLEKKFEFVVASGIFYLRVDDMDAYFRRMLDAMWNHCIKGIGFNMLSIFAPVQPEEEYFFDPAEVFKVCSTYTRRIALRHDYKQNDFSVLMYRQD